MGTRTRLPAGFYKDIFDSVLARERRIPCAVPPQVLGKCTVERIVAKRFREKKAFFLVRWKGYDPEEDTWEPKQHLPDDILCKFENPEPHIVGVDDARKRLALVIEKGMRRCLRTSEIIDVRHDAVRGLFPNMPSQLGPTFFATENDLICAGLQPHLEHWVRGILHHKKVQVGFSSAAAATPWPPSNSDGTKKKRRAVKRPR